MAPPASAGKINAVFLKKASPLKTTGIFGAKSVHDHRRHTSHDLSDIKP
jgi:hypothetical protein